MDTSTTGRHHQSPRDELVRDLLDRAAATPDGPERKRLLGDVVVEYRGVAKAVARRYQGRGVDLEDLEQVAYLGMVKAAHRWESGKCENFLQYAVPTMTGDIRRYFRDHLHAVRLPRGLQQIRMDLAALSDEDAGQDISEAELSRKLGVHEYQLREARAASAAVRPESLDRPRPGYEDGITPPVEELGYLRVEFRQVLAELLAGLDDRDRQILRLRFRDGLSQTEIGRKIGVSQMQVSRLLARIVAKARRICPPEIALAA